MLFTFDTFILIYTSHGVTLSESAFSSVIARSTDTGHVLIDVLPLEDTGQLVDGAYIAPLRGILHVPSRSWRMQMGNI